jgi:hypothetical protein
MGEPNIHDFPWLIEELGIDVNKLGCVMLPVAFLRGMIEKGYESGALSTNDLFTASNPDHFWIKGDVSGSNAHVTLLYGLLAPAFEEPTSSLILHLFEDAGWRAPSWLPIEGFDIFPSNLPDEDYGCIVARIGDPDGVLARAHALLEYLPHVNTFEEWKLHATIAYVKSEAAPAWVEYLQAQPALMVAVPDGPLDLGSSH